MRAASTESPQRSAEERSTERMLIAVAGNPNSGKTTLFNALTGLRQKVGNYPGVTVEKREGRLVGASSTTLIDLPGIYSLTPRSADEQITQDVLLGRIPGTDRPNAVLVVVDATNLERNLFLATQIIELGLPVVIACNMTDLLKEAGHHLDTEILSQCLGVPVVETVGSRRTGINQLRTALLEAGRQRPSQSASARRWKMSAPVEREIDAIASAVRQARYAPPEAADAAALLLLSMDGAADEVGVPLPVGRKVQEAHRQLEDEFGRDLSLEIVGRRYAWIAEIVEACLKRSSERRVTLTDRLDRVLTHHVWGYVFFIALMGAMFYSVFSLAGPLAEGIEDGVGALREAAADALPVGPFSDLLIHGVLAGVGAVVVFFPQIAMLFLFVSLLEDSGYMARGAFLMNRFMGRVGLHGKSFIPLLSAHACAVPSILSTRMIESPRERLATILVLPFVSCSARLPVYLLIIAACLPMGAASRAGVLSALYVLGILTAFAVAWLMRHSLLRGATGGFIIELPSYRMPRLRAVAGVVWDRCREFLVRAGTIILAVTIVLWVLMSYPKPEAERVAEFDAQRAEIMAAGGDDADAALTALQERERAETVRGSFAGRLGQFIEPAIRPLGYNWEIGVGLVASFAAREVFVSTMGIVYSVGDAEEDSGSLHAQMRAATWPDGSRLFTPLAAVSLLVFYALACQCVATLAVVKQETRSWLWPVLMFVYMTALAYLAALLVYQAGTALGF
jgi:ferrous iron transport protein B